MQLDKGAFSDKYTCFKKYIKIIQKFKKQSFGILCKKKKKTKKKKIQKFTKKKKKKKKKKKIIQKNNVHAYM